MEKIRFIDLFGGIGGFRLGLEQASKRFECVWYNDIDKYAVQIYNERFGENYEPRDIRKIKAEEIPDFDMLCAGFPCQSFSIAGRRKGFADTRGTLFFEIARIVECKRPKYLLLENVKGLLSHDQGKTFRTIIRTLDELGYDAEWQVLNSKHFGVPQNRERVFIIGYSRGECRKKIFPIRKDAGKIQGIPRNKGIQVVFNVFDSNSENGQIFSIDGISRTLKSGETDNPKSGGIGSSNAPKIISACITTENAHGYGKNVTVRQTEAIQKAEREMIHQGVLRKGKYGDGYKKECSFTLDQTCGRDLTVYDTKGFDSKTKGFRERKDETPALTQKMGTGGNNVPMICDYRKDEGFRERDNESPTLTSHGDSKGGVPVPMVSKKDIFCVDDGDSLERQNIMKNISPTLKHSRSGYVIGEKDDIEQLQKVANCLDASMYKGVDPKGFYDKKRRNLIKIKKHKNVFGKHQQDSVYESDGLMSSLPAGTHGSTPHLTKTYHNERLRRLTPVECERLQGFPDNHTKGVSDTQRYKQLGNAVTVNVIKAIGEKFIETIDDDFEPKKRKFAKLRPIEDYI